MPEPVKEDIDSVLFEYKRGGVVLIFVKYWSNFGGSDHSKVEPFEVSIWFTNPGFTRPVPPWVIGIVEQSIVKEPDEVISNGEIDRKGVEVKSEIAVTVPLVGVVYSSFFPVASTERIWFGDPRMFKPVPPYDIEIGSIPWDISNTPDSGLS